MTINKKPYTDTKDDSMPTPKAYKFIKTSEEHSLESLHTMINQNAIWLSHIDNFNDPMEMASFTSDSDLQNSIEFIFRDLRKILEKDDGRKKLLKAQEFFSKFISNEMTLTDDHLKLLLDGLNSSYELDEKLQNHGHDLVGMVAEKFHNTRQSFVDSNRIYCLTTNIGNSAMWAYYGDYHKGIAVEYFRMSPVSKYAQQVTYTDRTPILSVKYLNHDYLTTKNIYWQHESERRFIVNLILHEKKTRKKKLIDVLRKKNKNQYPGDFIDRNYFQFNEESLKDCGGHLVKAIYFGLNTSEEDKNSITKIVENAEYPIFLLQSCPDPTHYSINFCQLG